MVARRFTKTAHITFLSKVEETRPVATTVVLAPSLHTAMTSLTAASRVILVRIAPRITVRWIGGFDIGGLYCAFTAATNA
jgi:hypothetical protein